LFTSPAANDDFKAAAAYGLCGVYQKIGNPVEQIHFALWLDTANKNTDQFLTVPSGLADRSIYWAISGWDLSLLLDAEAPTSALEQFIERYPNQPDIRLVKYSLAVRLTREERYEEAAQLYESIRAVRRAPRLRKLTELARAAATGGPEAKYKLAEFISGNPDRIFFNDALWLGMQRYALTAEKDSKFTRMERDRQIALERRLRDEQEERWRAYLILREVMQEAGKSELGRRAARLAQRCLRQISWERFGREEDFRRADKEVAAWLQG
jgi:hypothetical protein